MLPPWPGWDGLHPLVIHFPIGLLMVSPLFALLAALLPRRASGFSVSALVLLALGTIAALVAVSTGQAAAELAERNDAINAVLARHEELAETTAIVFSVLTVLYAAALALSARVAALARPVAVRTVNGVFFALLLAASLLVVNVGHQGGRLVHQLGVRAMMSMPATAAR